MNAIETLKDPKALLIPLNEATELLELYLQTKSESTKVKYKRTFNKYLKDYRNFSVSSLQLWYHDLTSGNYSQSYQSTQYYTLKSFFTYLKLMNVVKFNPLDVYKLKKATKISHHQPLNVTQLAKLYNPAKGGHEICMLVRLQLLTGMRSHEAVSLIHFEYHSNNAVLIVKGKGDKFRRLRLNEECRRYYFKLLKHKQLFAKTLDKADIQQATRNYRARLKTFNQQLKIEHFSSHQLRATFATKLYEHGTTIESIAKILGHSSIETTKSYISALSDMTPVEIPDLDKLYDVPQMNLVRDTLEFGSKLERRKKRDYSNLKRDPKTGRIVG